MSETVTPQTVAQYMLDRPREEEPLDQENIAHEILDKFGESFVYTNENGNLAIGPAVLRRLNALTKETVVWAQRSLYWCWRTEDDEPGRRRVYE